MNRAIFGILAVLLALATFALVSFVGVTPSQKSVFVRRPDTNTILFGTTPWGESRKMKEAYEPLLNFLGEETGKKFQLLVLEDYEAAIDAVVEGIIDIAVLPPVSYVLAKNREDGIQYISTIVREDGEHRYASYYGYIVALRSRFGRKTFDDILEESKKHHFGFVTRRSSSGYAYPMAMMRKRGINPEKAFRQVTIFENHPGVTDAIASGVVDFGATWDYNLEQARKIHGDIFSVLYQSSPIPGLAWVATKGIEQQLVNAVRGAQEKINTSDELRKKLCANTPEKGWQLVDEAFYDEVRDVITYVGAIQ